MLFFLVEQTVEYLDFRKIVDKVSHSLTDKMALSRSTHLSVIKMTSKMINSIFGTQLTRIANLLEQEPD